MWINQCICFGSGDMDPVSFGLLTFSWHECIFFPASNRSPVVTVYFSWTANHYSQPSHLVSSGELMIRFINVLLFSLCQNNVQINAVTNLINKVNANEPRDYEWFGNSVKIYKNTVIVGYQNCDVNQFIDAGCVYIYQYNNITNKFNQTQKITSNNLTSYEWFGHSVSISTTFFDSPRAATLFAKNWRKIRHFFW